MKTKEKSKAERACTLFPGPISPPNPLLLRVPPEPDDIYQPRGCSTGNAFPAARSFVERTFAAHFCALAKRKRASPPHERGTAPPAEKQAPRRSAPPRKNREEQRGHPAEPGVALIFQRSCATVARRSRPLRGTDDVTARLTACFRGGPRAQGAGASPTCPDVNYQIRVVGATIASAIRQLLDTAAVSVLQYPTPQNLPGS